MARLAGWQLKQIHEVLLEAYSEAELRRFLLFEMDIRFENVVAAGSQEETYFALLKWLESKQRIEQFIEALASDNSNNPIVSALCQDARTWFPATMAASPDLSTKGEKVYRNGSTTEILDGIILGVTTLDEIVRAWNLQPTLHPESNGLIRADFSGRGIILSVRRQTSAGRHQLVEGILIDNTYVGVLPLGIRFGMTVEEVQRQIKSNPNPASSLIPVTSTPPYWHVSVEIENILYEFALGFSYSGLAKIQIFPELYILD